jgi:hypothetical protein
MNPYDDIKPSSVGFWLCLLIYLLAFVLPMELHENSYTMGFTMFWCGGVGVGLSLFGLLGALFHGFSWDGVRFGLATVPWLANLLLWFGLALYAQGHGRASFRTALVAVVLAAGVLVTSPWWHSFSLTARENVLQFLTSPAYLAWTGSMGLLLVLAGRLAWRQNRVAGLWRPTRAWLAENASDAADDFGSAMAPRGTSASEEIVAQKPADSSVTRAADAKVLGLPKYPE